MAMHLFFKHNYIQSTLTFLNIYAKGLIYEEDFLDMSPRIPSDP